jgi:hypothetical protein
MTDLPNATPPVNASDPSMFDLPEPQAWPKPVGITSIVLGAFNLMCGGLGGVYLLVILPFWLAEAMKQHFTDGIPPQFESVSIPMVVSTALSLMVDGLLLTAGISLLMRKSVARPMHLAYVVMGLLSFAIGTWVGVSYQAEMTEWMKANPDTKFAQEQGAGGVVGQVIGWTWAILTGFTWPVFCAIWFGLVKKKSSDITEGVQAVI